MSVVSRIIKDSIERLKVDELLAKEFEQAGYGGIILTKTPLGAQINLFTMRPGRVIGKRGRSIRAASDRLENELGLSNPQITVLEVEVPELDARIMASRIANALERGVHYRRAIFWALRRIMESGALGCEIVVRGKLRSNRTRFEKVGDGYMPKSGDPALKQVKSAVFHVKLKRGILGVSVSIVPPDAKFPDKISLEGLPEVEVPEEEHELPEGVEPEVPEAVVEAVEPPAVEAVEEAEAAEEAATEEEQVVERAPEAEADASPVEAEASPEEAEEVEPATGAQDEPESSDEELEEAEAAVHPEGAEVQEG
ncbi:MAG: 30S ribosomal protein S3 [Candidatus Bathyarchaeota archaeon]|nr:30S ribosomal protein S3 [Candidatus Bathyarchaeota archaeon]